MKVRKLTPSYEAVRVQQPEVLGELQSGIILAMEMNDGRMLKIVPGDWILTNASGKSFMVDSKTFEREFEQEE